MATYKNEFIDFQSKLNLEDLCLFRKLPKRSSFLTVRKVWHI